MVKIQDKNKECSIIIKVSAGFDGVYIKGTLENPTEIIIIESKQFKYTRDGAGELEEFKGVRLGNPNPDSGLPSQMSDGWIDYVIGKLPDGEVKTSLFRNWNESPNLFKKYVSAIDRTKGEVNILKLGAYE